MSKPRYHILNFLHAMAAIVRKIGQNIQSDKKAIQVKLGKQVTNANPKNQNPISTGPGPTPPKSAGRIVLKKEEVDMRPFGIVVEHLIENGTLVWTKVLTVENGTWVTRLDFKPNVKRALGVGVRYTPGEHKGKITVTKAETVLFPITELEEFFMHIEKQEEIQSVYITHIAARAKNENKDAMVILEEILQKKTILGRDDSRIYFI